MKKMKDILISFKKLMEEPVYIPGKKKIRFKKTNALERIPADGLTTGQWYQLICPHLELVDLIMLTRTCRAFVGSKSITTLLTQKHKAAFSGFNQRHWNKLKTCKSVKKIEDIKIHHAGKFIIVDGKQGYISAPKSYRMGAFSTKQRMIDCLQTSFSQIYQLKQAQQYEWMKQNPTWSYGKLRFKKISKSPKIIELSDMKHVYCVGLTKSEIREALGVSE